METEYAPNSATRIGTAYADFPCTSGADDSCGRIAGQVLLRNRNATRPDFEAVSSLRSGNQRSLLPFDNVAGHQTVLMLANADTFRQITVTAAIKDANGNRIHLDQFNMQTRSSMLINMAEKWPQSQGIRGTVELTTQSSSLILTALRINPSNSFASIEAFEWF